MGRISLLVTASIAVVALLSLSVDPAAAFYPCLTYRDCEPILSVLTCVAGRCQCKPGYKQRESLDHGMYTIECRTTLSAGIIAGIVIAVLAVIVGITIGLIIRRRRLNSGARVIIFR